MHDETRSINRLRVPRCPRLGHFPPAPPALFAGVKATGLAIQRVMLSASHSRYRPLTLRRGTGAEPTPDDIAILAQRGSNLPNGLALRTQALRLFRLCPYIALLLALPTARRTISGLVAPDTNGS